MPVQRVLKYHLILRELMSNTAAAHEEHHLIQQAYEAMLDVSDYINEVSKSNLLHFGGNFKWNALFAGEA